jgi:hypothetical protein
VCQGGSRTDSGESHVILPDRELTVIPSIRENTAAKKRTPKTPEA